MKLRNIKLALWLLLLCPMLLHAGAQTNGPTQQVTDMEGRQVTLPTHINRVYCVNPACGMLLYNLAPEKLTGWTIPMTPEAYRFLGPNAQSIPPLPRGGPGSNNELNLEQVLSLHPDVIMMMANASTNARADRIQQQTGLPVYMIDEELANMPRVFTDLGHLLGADPQAAKLAQYASQTLNEISRVARSIPAAQRKHVYFATGPNGLQTYPSGAAHAQMIPFVGAINVAETGNAGLGAAQVSPEQLLAWNPDVILAVTSNSTQTIDFYRHALWTDPVWSSLKAVKSGNVYLSPRLPFNWIDPPFSSNRLLGLKWLAQTLYPDRFHFDIRAEARQFYATFYHRQLTDAEITELLADSKPH